MSKELNKKEDETNKQDDQLQTEKQEAQPEEAKNQEKLEKEQEEPPPPSAEELKELRINAAKAEEYYERLLRQVAETDNLRKRLAKEKQDAIRYANESLIEQLLPTMDSFDMAISAANSTSENTIDSLKTGVEMVHGQLKRTLEDTGLTEIDATGQIFNPALHEAISRKETDEAADGTVIEQIRKGYQLNERLVRPASVIVATSPNSETEQKESEDE
ncbi:MAG: nucleotide exchange factor GrpE [Verrucomicrobiota bacterium]|jgi:molecular chaperone GrpE|nr:nucleotide exchange factor GrpE [Verrucomicrobiota bacterium]